MPDTNLPARRRHRVAVSYLADAKSAVQKALEYERDLEWAWQLEELLDDIEFLQSRIRAYAVESETKNA